MSHCTTCGNEYAGNFDVTLGGRTYTFDCFECAIHALAPHCSACGCRIIGHGVQSAEVLYCCTHCARKEGVQDLRMHTEERPAAAP